MPEKWLDLFFYKKRLKTFKKWPFQHPSKCTKENVAAAGFHFIGTKKEPDLVQCVVCFKELDGWEEDDDPWEEHSRRTNCPFIALNKTDAEMTAEDLSHLVMSRMYKHKEKNYDDISRYFEAKREEYLEELSSLRPS